MKSKRNKTSVLREDYADIPSTPLRILAFLISRSAYSGDAAVKVSVIARDLAIEVDEVVFVCKELAAPGFAVIEVCEIVDRAPQHRSVWVATSPEDILVHSESLDRLGHNMQARGHYLRRVAKAMSSAQHPW